MAFDPTLPDLDEAVRAWIMARMTAKLPLLNAALGRDNLTPVGALTGDMVLYGDPQVLPDVSVAPVLFCVQGGGRADSLDMQMEQKYFGGVPYRYQIYSSILVYLHPNALPGSDNVLQESGRERLLARICGWLRQACFNSADAVSPTLTSREFALAPNFDVLDRAHLVSIEKDWVYKGFAGNKAIYHAHARHYGEIDGSQGV